MAVKTKSLTTLSLFFNFFLLFIFLCYGSSWGGSGSAHVADELLVQLKPGTAANKADKLFRGFGASETGEIEPLLIKRIKVPSNALDKVKEALAKNPNIEFVENNFIAEAFFTPNDVNFPSQWHLPKIAAPWGWDISTGSAGVPIAVIDSGVDSSHPDLAGKVLPGYNFVSESTDASDVHGHGTAVAGSVAAASHNAIGVAGVAWDNPIMPLAVLNSSNWATYYDIARAITYAADRGVRIMNISIAGPSSSVTLQNAVDYAWNRGAVIFAAAANNSTSAPYYPAACNNVVAVSATTSGDVRASFSNFGNWVDISAPGVSILTTNRGGGYGWWSGTSFASPIAAGLGALVLSVNPSLTNAQVVEIIESSADDLGALGFDPDFGHGRINVYNSLIAASASPPQPDTTPPSASITSPGNGSVVKDVVIVSVSASDNVGVAEVELYINGTFFASDTTEPFNFSWDTTAYPDGSHQLRARAYDSTGNGAQSASVTVSVSNPVQADTTPPAVSITSPSEGLTVSRNLTVIAVATDDTAVDKVNFYVDGVLKSVVTSSTNTYSWNWNARRETEGFHVISAEAVDKAGNSSTASVTVQKSGSSRGKRSGK